MSIFTATIFAITLASWNMPSSPQSRETPVLSIYEYSIGLGDCKNAEISVDLHGMMIISNQRVPVDATHESTYAEIQRDNIRILNTIHDGSALTVSVSDFINLGEDLDISLDFVYVDRELYVFWRETFINREYKQGLVEFDGDGNLKEICRGVGGARWQF